MWSVQLFLDVPAKKEPHSFFFEPRFLQILGNSGDYCRNAQPRPPVAAVLDSFTPPPLHVIVQPGNLVSTISSLLTSQVACAAPPGFETRGLNAHLFDLLESSNEDIPSPKKTLPDFTLRTSDDDSVASGNDSITWEKEEDRVIHSVTNKLVLEDALEDSLEDASVKELEE